MASAAGLYERSVVFFHDVSFVDYSLDCAALAVSNYDQWCFERRRSQGVAFGTWPSRSERATESAGRPLLPIDAKRLSTRRSAVAPHTREFSGAPPRPPRAAPSMTGRFRLTGRK